MSDPLVVTDAEYGTLRVFALDLPDAGKDQLEPAFLESLLGAEHFLPEKAEIVEVDKLGDLGLGGYLTAGYGLNPSEIERDSERLAGSRGHVALVPASAFGGRAQRLTPKPPAHFIGLYREQGTATPSPMAPVSAAQETTPPPPQTGDLSEGPKRKGAPVVVAIVGVILVLLVLLLLL